MSDTDSFIEEVTEEVRRDRLFALMKKYGWIAVLAILVIVGGASWNEYTKAKEKAASEALGDSIVAALGENESSARAEKLSEISSSNPGGAAIVDFMRASAMADQGDVDGAVSALDQIAVNSELEPIYRSVAAFKSLTLQSETANASDLRIGFEALAQPGNRLRLLAEEQLALLDIRAGDGAAAIDRLQAILNDAELTRDLQRRAAQLIFALGGEPQERSEG